MALDDREAIADDWAAAEAIYAELTAERLDQRRWYELPMHRRRRYVLAAMAAGDEYRTRRGIRATVIAYRTKEQEKTA